jgi:hypothetical protein
MLPKFQEVTPAGDKQVGILRAAAKSTTDNLPIPYRLFTALFPRGAKIKHHTPEINS